MGAPLDRRDVVSRETNAFAVWTINMASFDAFWNCRTQWRVAASMSGLHWIGLDYTACKIVLDSIAADAAVFADLRAMEGAALAVLNEPRS